MTPKPKAVKAPEYNLKSKRQMWQAYQHLLKGHEFVRACYRLIHAANEKLDFKKRDQIGERYYNDLMVETWVALNGIKKLSRRQFNCDIAALEVYK